MSSEREISHLYGGEVRLEFSPAAHRYWVIDQGEKVDGVVGVTTALGVIDKPGLKYWAANCAVDYLRSRLSEGVFSADELEVLFNEARTAFNQVSQTALDVGTQAHNWIESRELAIKCGMECPALPENPNAAHCCNAYLDWMTQHNVKVLHSEKRLYSRQNKVVGTLDQVAMIDDSRRVIIDFKSSKDVYDDYYAQTAAYQMMYEEEMDEKIDGRIVLKLGKEDGSFYPGEADNETYQQDLNAFLAAKQLYAWKSDRKKLANKVKNSLTN